MDRVRIIDGPYKGHYGDAFYFPDQRLFHVKIPDRVKPYHSDFFSPESVEVTGRRRRSILEKRESVKMHPPTDDVQIIGCKGACGSVWCPECYKRKGGSKRFAKRLAKLDYKATRQVVLTVDLKKFNGSGQEAYETLRGKKAISQFIHDLKRTGQVSIQDWVWILEWHGDGAPHWHVFIQTQKGKKGMIGNKMLLSHWDYGMVFESPVRSKAHWNRFVDYFGANGYFNPSQSTEAKNKIHQLTLPDWAKRITYKIRKTGGMVKKRDETSQDQQGQDQCIEENEEDSEEKKEEEKEVKTYEELLSSCGQTTVCQIRRGAGWLGYRKIPIPYKSFTKIFGEYKEGVGYIVQMKLWEFFLFLEFYIGEIAELC